MVIARAVSFKISPSCLLQTRQFRALSLLLPSSVVHQWYRWLSVLPDLFCFCLHTSPQLAVVIVGFFFVSTPPLGWLRVITIILFFVWYLPLT